MSRTSGRPARYGCWLVLTLILGVTTSLNAQAPQPAPPGVVVGVGNFAHIVADLDKSLGFYRDVLGLTVTGTIPYGPNDAVAKFGHTEGGQSRVAVVKVPGIAMGIELIEYKDIEREPQRRASTIRARRIWRCAFAISMGCFPKIAAFPGVKILTEGGKPVTHHDAERHAARGVSCKTRRLCRRDARRREPAGRCSAGPVIAGCAFEATVATARRP